MSETASGGAPVTDLGGVSLTLPPEGDPVRLDIPLPHDEERFFSGAVDRLKKLGGLPRLLFIASASNGRESGAAAIALARALASRAVSTLLVDACLEEAALAKPFSYQPDEGFVDMVLWGASVEATIRKSADEQIRFIGVGSPPPDAAAVLHAADFESVLNTLREQAEVVLVVSPLFGADGELSPIMRSADRTVIIRRRSDPSVPIYVDLPAGRIAEITMGGEGSDLSPPVEETAEEIVRKAMEVEDPVVAPADEAVSGGTARDVRPVAADRTAGGSTAPAAEADRPAERTIAESAKPIPVGRFVLLFGAATVVLGLVISFLWVQRRFEQPGAPTEIVLRESGAGTAEETPAEPPATNHAAADEPRQSTSPADGRAEETPPAPIVAPPEEQAVDGGKSAGGGARTADSPVAAEESPPPEAHAKDAPRRGAPASSAAQRIYGVHVESFPTGMEADQAAGKYVDAGFPVTIKVVDLPGKGTWHRIILGRLTSRTEAKAYAEKVKETFGLDYAMVVKIEK